MSGAWRNLVLLRVWTRAMNRLVRVALKKSVCAGDLRITTARGTTYTLGDGTRAPVALRFTTRAAERGVILDPELKLGESYMDGTLIVERGSIADVLAVVHSPTAAPPLWARPRPLWRHLPRPLEQLNWRRRAPRHVDRKSVV